jgi:hypothetical protein
MSAPRRSAKHWLLRGLRGGSSLVLFGGSNNVGERCGPLFRHRFYESVLLVRNKQLGETRDLLEEQHKATRHLSSQKGK